MNFDQLLSALAGVPVLRGARCRGRHTLFDPRHDDEPAEVADARHLQALALCQQCPAIAECEQWLDALPKKQRPFGVIAGQLHRQPNPRKKRKKAS